MQNRLNLLAQILLKQETPPISGYPISLLCSSKHFSVFPIRIVELDYEDYHHSDHQLQFDQQYHIYDFMFSPRRRKDPNNSTFL